MASMRDIRRRRDSIENTQQITKAMKLVATVKLQRAKAKAEESKPYFGKLYETVQSILSMTEKVNHPYLVHNGSEKKGVLVVTSNRGLAGGYNNNVVKKIVETGWNKEDLVIWGIGRKGIEALKHRGYAIHDDDSDVINNPLFSDAVSTGREMLDAYLKQEIGEIYVAYTYFKNTLVHETVLLKLLPVDVSGFGTEQGDPEGTGSDFAGLRRVEESGPAEGKESSGEKAPMNFEPDEGETLDQLIPKYIHSIIYGALIEAVASENGARMQAMDSATSNAQEMIAALSLAYNRARQGAITQELTEIISGAEALS